MLKRLVSLLLMLALAWSLLPGTALAAENQISSAAFSDQAIVFLGDSITGNFQEKSGPLTSIPYLIAQTTGATTHNAAFGGCGMAERTIDAYGAFHLPALSRAIASSDFSQQEAALGQVAIPNAATHLQTLKDMDWQSVDTIVIAYGTNDFTASVPISGRDPYSLNTVQGALRRSIRTIHRAYPHIRFVLCSVMPRFHISGSEAAGYTYTAPGTNLLGATLEDYADAIEEVAASGNHLFADWYHCGITAENAGDYFSSSDGIHPLLAGREKAADAILQALGYDPARHDPLVWAAENGITSIADPVAFASENDCTRAQAMTFLWRAMDAPSASQATNLTDVSPDAYYADAVSWAVEQGITQGASTDTFSPTSPVSRAQAVTFLWRLAGCPASKGEQTFTDAPDDAYYSHAVAWAVEQGITQGFGDNTFAPARTCTRGQFITFLFRYLSELESSQ